MKEKCPLCGEIHELETQKKNEKVHLLGDEVEYVLEFYYCPTEEEEFITPDMMNKSLQNAKNAYRIKHHLLTSAEIEKIEQKSGLDDAAFSKALGLGKNKIREIREGFCVQSTLEDTLMKKYAEKRGLKHGIDF